MELINATGMQAGYTGGLKPDGRELVVVVVKGTFRIPENKDEVPRLADEQVPLVMADEFTGEPGYSATLYEADYAPFKPRCDVLFNGSAYAPGGNSTDQVEVSLRVGSLRKTFRVVGNRYWDRGLTGTAPTPPRPFTVMPISYDNAFGGTDDSHADPARHSAYQANSVGKGYHGRPNHESVVGMPLPNTEEVARIITSPQGDYRPMAFGPIMRSSATRLKYAGTYDDEWVENGFPFLPDDFDNRYYQAAPEDQQIDYLRGGELVELRGLTPQGLTVFRLPTLKVPVEFTDQDFEREEISTLIDTVIIEPDQNRLMVLWRVSRPLKINLFELIQCVVGRMPKGWYRARSLRKDYYSSLGVMVAAHTEEEGE